MKNTLADAKYNRLVKKILSKGAREENRTGVDAIGIFGYYLEFDLRKGFPILTTRKLPTTSTWVELEGFINGVTSKKWYKSRGCHFWNHWCNPALVPYSTDEFTKDKMRNEDDLGEIYGFQWRGPSYPGGRGPDQLRILVEKLVKKHDDRRLIVDAWNPNALGRMALVPCHRSFQCHIEGEWLDLLWDQRSVDVACGLPQNIVSYATLLHILAMTAGLKPRFLKGSLGDTHIYENHIETITEQIERPQFEPPTFKFKTFTDIWHFEHTQCELENYLAGEAIKYPVSV